MATWVGFEPTNRLRFPVFKTGSISHSDTKPYKKGPFGPSAATVSPLGTIFGLTTPVIVVNSFGFNRCLCDAIKEVQTRMRRVEQVVIFVV